jgi:hypothetical protein
MPPKKPLSPPEPPSTDKYSHTGIENADRILRETTMMPSTIETIDTAMFKYLDETLNLHVNTNKGFTKVPVIWVAGERAFQIKNNRNLRDANDVLIFPMMTLERTSLRKDASFKGVAWAHLGNVNDAKGGAIEVARRINQEKTGNFVNADKRRTQATLTSGIGPGQENYPGVGKKIVYETLSMPIPTYIESMYKITVRTEYQQQINELISPFFVRTGQINSFFIKHEGHKFEGFIQGDFSQDFNAASFQDEERIYKTSIDIKVLGYLLGESSNAARPKITIRENAVEFKFGKEQVVFDEKPNYRSTSFYRR